MSKWEPGDDEITIEFDNTSGVFSPYEAIAGQPLTFIAVASGRYHFVSGQQPHLVEDCTEECATWATACSGLPRQLKLLLDWVC